MQMHKIELHTAGMQLDTLDFLFDFDAEIIGGVALRHFKFSSRSESDWRGIDHDPVAKGSSADTKVEVFISEPPPSLFARLATVTAVRDVRITRCTMVDAAELEQSITADQEHSATVAVPIDPASVHCAIEPAVGGGSRLKIEAAADRSFLEKIFFILCSYQLSITSGKKFRQGEDDYAILTIPSHQSELLTEIVSRLEQELMKSIVDSRHVPTLAANPGKVTGITLSRKDLKGLATLRITATSTIIPLLRYKVHALFNSLDLDVYIARMQTRGDAVDDTYHLRVPTSITDIDVLADTLGKHLQGK